jgi:hypothetical protein
MKKKLLIMGLAFGVFTACQTNDEVGIENQISEISPADLPSASQSFIDRNFTGEVVSDAYKVTGADNQVTYEAFMSNNTNLVFHEESNLMGFGNINSRMEMEGEMFSGGMQNMGAFGSGYAHGNNGMMGQNQNGMMGNGYSGMMGQGHHEFRNHMEITPVQLDEGDLPTATLDYLHEHYADNEILMVFELTSEDESEYHVLIQEVGGLIFDADGNFEDMVRRGMGHCEAYEEVELDNLPELAQSYIQTTYPDAEVIKARVGSHDNIKELHVLIENIGILVFDVDGNFIELMERRRTHHG